jgi:glutathione synthase/RimK-type ligase-like ATP-grasp enzyme
VAKYAYEEANAYLKGLWYFLGHKTLWVNHPHANIAANYKLNQLGLANRMGFHLPNTIITNSPEDAQNFYDKYGKIVVKPLASVPPGIIDAMGQKVMTTHLLTENEAQLLHNVSISPCILQEYVEKEIELRVTIIGESLFAVALDSQNTEYGKIDWRISLQAEDLIHIPYDLPPDIESKCRELVRVFGLKFGAIDLILTPSGEYVFLEINPNGQWVWIEQLTGLPMIDTMIKLLQSES